MDINGHTVHQVMVAEGADIAEEYYFSLLLDRANRQLLAMCSVEGGVDIETLAEERPEALAAGTVKLTRLASVRSGATLMGRHGCCSPATRALSTSGA